jgi:hypothetical protein
MSHFHYFFNDGIFPKIRFDAQPKSETGETQQIPQACDWFWRASNYAQPRDCKRDSPHFFFVLPPPSLHTKTVLLCLVISRDTVTLASL